jgi:hypothetical protein
MLACIQEVENLLRAANAIVQFRPGPLILSVAIVSRLNIRLDPVSADFFPE